MNKPIKLHLACCKVTSLDYRPILEYIKVTKEKCVATDRKILAVVPTDFIFSKPFISKIPEDGFLLHAKDYKKLLKYDLVTWSVYGCIIEMPKSKKRSSLIKVFKESEIGAFPKWESTVPSSNNLKKELKKSISIDAKLLHRLQKSLGISDSHLIFFEGHKPIEVKPTTKMEKGVLGVLAPVLLPVEKN